LTAPQSQIDPYRFPGARDFDEEPDFELPRDRGHDGTRTPAPDEAGDYLLAAPDPRSRRLPFVPAAADRRRLELHAALTAAGIPPLPGDTDAIQNICALDDATVTAVRRWVCGAL
jgi:hypothetical protein